MSSRRLFWQALAAFLVLPGVAAVAVPILYLWCAGRREIVFAWGVPILALGAMGLLWCVRDFYVRGKGTLAPWSAPQRLVVVGLYRCSRNPMYLSVVLLVVGIAVTYAALPLGIYAIALALGFHLWVVRSEEPRLRNRFGENYEKYCAKVRRWL